MTLAEVMFAWIHYWKTTLQEKLHAAMAWKQRRSQYQDHFPTLEILPQKWELSIMQLKYWNPIKTETRPAELYQEELITEQIQYQTWCIMI